MELYNSSKNTVRCKCYFFTITKTMKKEVSNDKSNSSKALWDVLLSFSVQNSSEQAITTDGQYFYTAKWQTDALIGKYTSDGTFVENLTITGVTAGIRDFCTDGTYFYARGGTLATSIYKLDFTNNTLVSTITSPVSVRHLSYDPTLDGGNGGFWVGDFATLSKIKKDGTLIETLTVPSVWKGVYSTAYDDASAGGPYLWAFNQDATEPKVDLIKYRIATNTIVYTYDVGVVQGVNSGSLAGGLESSKTLYPGKFVLIANVQQTPNFVVVLDVPEILPYSVTYNGNGNTGGTAPTDANDYFENDNVTVLGAGDLVKEGYTFNGWNTAVDGSGTTYAAAATMTMPASNVTLYAQWSKATYNITYNADGGTHSNPANFTITDLPLTLTDANKEGYTFEGWFLESTFATKVTQITTIGNQALYAKFNAITYNITYNADGGTHSNPANFTITDLPLTLTDASKSGSFSFDGWFLESTFATKVTQITTTGNKELFAKFNSTVGINEIATTQVKIFPNPTNGMINIELNNSNVQQITVSDIAGKELIVKTRLKQNETIDLSELNNGVYFIHIKTDKGISTSKVVKE